MRKGMKKILLVMLLTSSAMIAGCSGNVGVGLNVGVPIGNRGYMILGTSRWL